MAFRLGIDPGFGNFKVACANSAESKPRVAIIPSVVGIGETDIGLLSLGNLGRRHRQAVPDKVMYGGVTYLVGENVARYARPLQRMDLLRLSDGPELRSLCYTAIYHLLGTGAHQIALMVGLPVEVMADRERGLATLRSLRGWLIGHHEFIVNEDSVVLEVTEVQAMPQPAGTFFAWGLNDDGHWIRGKEALKVPVAICDIGFNTLDLFAVQGGEVIARFTGGDTAGMRRAAELLSAAMRAKYGVEMSLHEADALICDKYPRIYTAAGEVNLRPLVAQALDASAAAIVTFVEQRWGNGRQFAYLLFTGGGAEVLREPLLRQYPHGIVLSNPVLANAIGLARYAVRVFK